MSRNRKIGNIKAANVSWELRYGAIPGELHVLHKCDTPACVNPEHLFLGTAMDNKHDSMAKRRHNFGQHNGRVKLTADQVQLIRAASGSLRKIAAQFGVTHRAIEQIKKHRNWRHI